MNQKLSIIITNYNTKDILGDCLDNLLKVNGTFWDFETIVVDNNSPDGSALMVENEFPWVTLIKSENKGLAHANNLGLSKATGEYILYLGSDAFPTAAAITGCLYFMDQSPRVAVSTAKLVTRSGRLDMDAHRGFPTPWASFTHFVGLGSMFPNSHLFNSYFLGLDKNRGLTGDFLIPHEIDLCISHFMMVRKSTFDTVGLWDETFFLYGEDVDFCWRVKQAGLKIMYLPQFAVLHFKGVSVGIRKETRDITSATPETRSRMRRETTKAMRHFYNKNMSSLYPALVNWLVNVGISGVEYIRTH